MPNHGCAQNRTRPETGSIINGVVEVLILLYVPDNTAAVLGYALADDTFARCQGNATNIYRSDAGLAHQYVTLLVQQKKCTAFCLDELHNQVQCLLDGFFNIECDGEVAAQVAAHLRQ